MNLKIKNKSLEYLNNNFSTRLYNVIKINRSDYDDNNNNNNNKNNSILLIQFCFTFNSTALGPITS
jgi:hypothetical protein